MIAVLPLGAGQLALAAALIVINACMSLALRLGLERRLAVAAVRSIAQLLLLGLLLQWVFRQRGPWTVLALMLAMALLAGFEAVRRTTRRVPGGFAASMGVMLFTSMVVTLYGLVAVVRVHPWYTPQYAIPLLGMLLGNSLTGVSLGLETVLEGFVRDREQVELLLAHGATPSEAARDVIHRSVRTGMIPILNTMVAAGTIHIPGMMTGQLLAGQDPGDAARYQIFILFCVAGGVALGTMGVVFAARRLVFDGRGRLRVDRIRAG